MEKYIRVGVACLLITVMTLCWQTARGQDDKEAIAARAADVDQKRVDEAVKKACEWLKNRQQADGHWEGKYSEKGYPDGITGLCLYALLKSGEDQNSKCIKKGFGYIKGKPFNKVYSVSTFILALTALYAPPPPEKVIEKEEKKKPEDMNTTVYEPYEKKMKDKFKKARRWVKDWLKRAVAWLIKKQNRNIWRYPGGYGTAVMEDASNTQYVLLAFYCAMRVGVPVRKDIFAKAARFFLENQEPDGPAVPGFPVPAADFDIAQLKEIERQMMADMKEVARQNKEIAGRAKESGGKVPELENPSTTVEMENPYKKYGGEPKKIKMKARGWSYVSRKLSGVPADWVKATGSMTTCGIAALIICKEHVEKRLKGKAKKDYNQAIRDGLAWLVHNWSVSSNPHSNDWQKYYLYGVERAAVLALCYTLGEHKWYKEGAEHLLSTQLGDGSWAADADTARNFGYGEDVSTCFAILFLKRATVPIIKPPIKEGIYTGEGIFKRKPPEK